jgi:hypothetical protein
MKNLFNIIEPVIVDGFLERNLILFIYYITEYFYLYKIR